MIPIPPAPLAAVGSDQPLPPSLAIPLVAIVAVLVALLLVTVLRKGQRPSSPVMHLLAVAGALFAVWAGGVLFVSLRAHGAESSIRGRQERLAELGAKAAAGLDELSAPLAPECLGRLETGSAASVAGYLVLASSGPHERLPRDFYPRLLAPSTSSPLSLGSISLPPRVPMPLPERLRQAVVTFPWRWQALWPRAGSDLSSVRYLVVASARSLDSGHRLEMAARIVPAQGGAALCEGTFTMQLPPWAGERSPLATSLDAAALGPACRAGGRSLCEHLQRFAGRVP